MGRREYYFFFWNLLLLLNRLLVWMQINFLFFFIRYYLYRNLKVEGSLKWKWSLVSFTIKCYNSTKKCMLIAKAEQSNCQVYWKKSYQKCRCISTKCQFYHAWVKRNELSSGMQSRIIWILSSDYIKTLWMCE